MRFALLVVVLAAVPCGAQDLPDPGRRLSQEEQNADPQKTKARLTEVRLVKGPRDAQACERARLNHLLSCGAPESGASRSMQCAEAYALYRSGCE